MSVLIIKLVCARTVSRVYVFTMLQMYIRAIWAILVPGIYGPFARAIKGDAPYLTGPGLQIWTFSYRTVILSKTSGILSCKRYLNFLEAMQIIPQSKGPCGSAGRILGFQVQAQGGLVRWGLINVDQAIRVGHHGRFDRTPFLSTPTVGSSTAANTMVLAKLIPGKFCTSHLWICLNMVKMQWWDLCYLEAQ